jgi:hypothetical protein
MVPSRGLKAVLIGWISHYFRRLHSGRVKSCLLRFATLLIILEYRYINSAGVNNPSYEFYPPKNINGHNGTKIPSQFLVDTLNGNLFPHMFVLPDTTLFVAANLGAMIFNWRTNTEQRLPNFPNGIRVTSVHLQPVTEGHIEVSP